MLNALPDGAADYVIALWVLAPVLTGAVAAFATRGVRANQRQHSEDLAEVREQVSNTHSTNLRDDMDSIMSELRGLRQDVSEVRTEVRDNRSETRELRTHVREVRQQSAEFEADVRALVRRQYPDEVL
ncbi:DUF2746 domain-containing protein [Nocardia vulneris]|uniref:DUF2746 domain-containing protein n=1 Tax=Nocardia vulneris TaxID=1141657 RepID=UPI0009E64477